MGHTKYEELSKSLDNLKSKVFVGDRYRHYKHNQNFYKIIAIGFIESTEEPCVVYQAEYGDKLTWVRTEAEFFSKAIKEDGMEVDRFVKVI